MKARRKNRVTLASALAVLAVMALLFALNGGEEGQEDLLNRPSTFFTDSTGALGVFLTAQRFAPDVRRLRQSLKTLPLMSGAERATVVVMAPIAPLAGGEREALLDWVRNGGQLVFADDRDWPSAPDLRSALAKRLAEGGDEDPDDAEAEAEASDFMESLGFGFESDEGMLSRGLEAGAPLAVSGWIQPDPTGVITPLATFEGRALAATRTLGEGRVLAVADGAVWSNGRLRQAGQNAATLIGACLDWGGPILFDERHLGFGEKRGLAALTLLFAGTPWGVVFIHLGLAGALYALATRSRFGPIRDPRVRQRRDPLELIAARAGFFSVARARDFCLEAIHKFTLRRLQERGKNQAAAVLDGRQAPDREPEPGLRAAAAYARLRLDLEEGRPLDDRQFIQAARLSGRILQEHRHARNRDSGHRPARAIDQGRDPQDRPGPGTDG